MEHVYIRGSKVRMMVIPDMLKHAPMFKRIDPKFDPKGGKK
jgi:small nuclear ribonucleoprotein D3